MSTLAFLVELLEYLPCPTIERIIEAARTREPGDPTAKLDEDLASYVKTQAKKLEPPAPLPPNPVHERMLGLARMALGEACEALTNGLRTRQKLTKVHYKCLLRMCEGLGEHEGKKLFDCVLVLSWSVEVREIVILRLIVGAESERAYLERFDKFDEEGRAVYCCAFSGGLMAHRDTFYSALASAVAAVCDAYPGT